MSFQGNTENPERPLVALAGETTTGDVLRLRAALRALPTPEKIIFLSDLAAGNDVCMRRLEGVDDLQDLISDALTLPEIDRLALVARIRFGDGS